MRHTQLRRRPSKAAFPRKGQQPQVVVEVLLMRRIDKIKQITRANALMRQVLNFLGTAFVQRRPSKNRPDAGD